MDIPFKAARPAGSKFRARLNPAFVASVAFGGLLLGAPAAEQLPNTKEESSSAEQPREKPGRQIAEPEAKPPDKPAEDGTGPATRSDPLLVPNLLELPPPTDRPPGSPRRTGRGRDEALDAEEVDLELGTAGEPDEAPPSTYLVPGLYGTAPTRLTAGEGPLSGPRFRASASLGVGYDDNIRSQAAESSAEKEASGFTNLGLNASYHMAGRLRVLILSGSATGDIFWSQVDPNYNFSLAGTYQRMFVGPYTLTANVALSYQNDADYGTVNTVREVRETDEERQNEDDAGGGYLSGSAKVDFTYRWGPQFSTVTSLAADARLYSDARSDDDAMHFTIGNQFRYLVDRYAWIGEIRYESISGGAEDGENTSLQGGGQESSNSIYVLGGVEWHLGPWIQLSSRLGASFRKYEQGGNATSPFGEFAVNFQPSVQNSFGLTAHYGLETSPAGGGDSKTFRVGLSYTRVFNPRLSGTLTASYVQSDETAESREGGFTVDDEGGGERIIDVTAGLNYRFSSRLSLSASLSCTRGTSSGQTGSLGTDPDRNRFVVGAVYEF